MNVLIAGGSGFIGRALLQELKDNGNDATVLTRNKAKASNSLSNGFDIIDYSDITNNNNHNKQYDVIVNLAGASIGSGRWTKKRKEKILSSRIATTGFIINAINKKTLEPKLLINASGVGCYGSRGDELLDENSEPGSGFLADVCRKWEAAAGEVKVSGIRQAYLRTGLVIGKGGVLNQLILPYKLFVGGNMGSGKQWVPWIHIKDVARIICHIIKNKDMEGHVNVVSPNPVQMKELQKTISKVMKRPYWLKVPAFALRVVLGEMADLVLSSQKVVPEKLNKSGYKFIYPDLEDALAEAILIK